jgi:hypothetical protein
MRLLPERDAGTIEFNALFAIGAARPSARAFVAALRRQQSGPNRHHPSDANSPDRTAITEPNAGLAALHWLVDERVRGRGFRRKRSEAGVPCRTSRGSSRVRPCRVAGGSGKGAYADVLGGIEGVVKSFAAELRPVRVSEVPAPAPSMFERVGSRLPSAEWGNRGHSGGLFLREGDRVPHRRDDRRLRRGRCRHLSSSQNAARDRGYPRVSVSIRMRLSPLIPETLQFETTIMARSTRRTSKPGKGSLGRTRIRPVDRVRIRDWVP